MMGKEILPLRKTKQPPTNNQKQPLPRQVTTTPHENGKRPNVGTIEIILGFMLMISVMGMAVYASETLNNPSEEWCQAFNQSGTAWQLMVVENGMCVKTETGFHANGRSIFK